MPNASVYFVGEPSEVQHHAASLSSRRRIEIVGTNEIVGVAQPGDLAIFYSEHFDRFRNSIRLLKANNVATLYLIDGILEWRNAWENQINEPACPYTMRPVLSHKAACIGAAQAEILDSWGNATKTEIVGVPRFDPFVLRDESKSIRTDDSTFRVLVMTAKTPGFTESQTAKVVHSLFDLKDGFAANPIVGEKPLDVIWRLTAGLDKTIDVENRLLDLSGKELVDLLPEVDAVISTQSTAMIEAMLCGLPVAALDYHRCPNYLQAAWNIRSADCIAEVLNDLAHPPASKILFQRNELNRQLYRENATDRLDQLIGEMLTVAGEQLAEHRTLDFGSRMLPPPTIQAPAHFSHASIFPDVTEFQNDDVAELQTELAHARREIKHLQREQNQLQSELNQAHEIFEQIHQHPIAGPIVRGRKKLIDWLSGFRKRNPEKPNLQTVSAQTTAQNPTSQLPSVTTTQARSVSSAPAASTPSKT